MGNQDEETTDALMRAVVSALKQSNKKPIIIASSDLSHFHSQDTAKELDKKVTDAFSEFDYFKRAFHLFNRDWEACGAGPIIAAMMICEQLGANTSKTIKYATSADTKMGRISPDRVVGYFSGAIGISKKTDKGLLPDLSNEEKELILKIAKGAVESSVNNEDFAFPAIESENLNINLPVFVTINKNEQLRACMGHIIANKSLKDEIKESAFLASKNDYRFGAVKLLELNNLEYEVTVLSRMKRITSEDEIIIGKHGLYIKFGRNSGLLLPQVAESLDWTAKTFLEQVCNKAGIPENTYLKNEAQVYIFEAIVIDEK